MRDMVDADYRVASYRGYRGEHCSWIEACLVEVEGMG